MFKLIRRLITLVFVLIVGLIVAVIYKDTVAEKAIETGGTFALGAKTEVGNVDVGLLLGSLTMEDFKVHNPSGFSDTPFIAVGKAEFEVGTSGSLFDKVVKIPRIAIDGTRVSIEKKDGRYNYEEVMDKLKRFQSEKKDDADAKRYIVDDLVITNTAVVPQGYQVAEVKVPEVRMQGIGRKDNKGVTLAELVGLIVESVMRGSASKLAGIAGLGDLAGDLNSRLGSLTGLNNLGVKVLDDLGGGIGGVLEGILGGKK